MYKTRYENSKKISSNSATSLKGCAMRSEDWRLVEFISKMEAYQGKLGFGLGSEEEKIARQRAEDKVNYRNRVSIKRYNIVDPLKADHVMAGKFLNEASMENTKSIATPPWLISNRRFPVSAHFLASWICENVRSSKSYRLVFLFDKMAKELFDKPIEDKKVILSQSIASNENLTARLATVRNLLAESNEAYDTKSSNHTTGKVNTVKSSNISIEGGLSSSETAKKKGPRMIKQKLIGLKLIISGRILGAEMARVQRFKRGQTPGNTISVIKDKAQVTAKTKTGTLGINLTTYWR